MFYSHWLACYAFCKYFCLIICLFLQHSIWLVQLRTWRFLGAFENGFCVMPVSIRADIIFGAMLRWCCKCLNTQNDLISALKAHVLIKRSRKSYYSSCAWISAASVRASCVALSLSSLSILSGPIQHFHSRACTDSLLFVFASVFYTCERLLYLIVESRAACSSAIQILPEKGQAIFLSGS